MSDNAEPPLDEVMPRSLPERIAIPPIRGEMVRLRPATLDDLDLLDPLDAFHGASRITGKDSQSERAAVHAWVRRSVAWSQGLASDESGVGDPESRRTLAWAVLSDAPRDDEHQSAKAEDIVIGMIFLIDIDGWARSARIQVILGKDYRGRGYSRDAMPRVMTYGFAPQPAGLGLHRIWVSVPEKNSRSLWVYQSLGFVLAGTSRDALWDAENGQYQDQHVLETLVDEYDPIRSLDAFGMHVIEDNPGVREALSAREHSLAIEQHARSVATDGAAANSATQESRGGKPGSSSEASGDANAAGRAGDDAQTRAQAPSQPKSQIREPELGDAGDDGDAALESLARNLQQGGADAGSAEAHDIIPGTDDGSSQEGSWPFASTERKSSKQAWWRSLGRSRKNDKEGSQ
ncbi:MAG: GNAT family N-acetyltransferase [Bifidobacterium tibiigranuli]|jgi:RimJ/RimL family protein N-acetyltransferase|uniref:GNAT family N-acetyltransferase n=1 Tax=Bifidobacterium tibiigranuli TaxID=2172043 RepID=UPI0023521EC0|nr:GNAT family protein [Bifidobacterium tibiigranuli]MCH3975406.1 GNAT family N-acetyltransferase [Bifidobacterium tibiigranuli]MCH4189696.1 GNAT family N-acetyltransferase [Bifidobacterium tibiigranuli]MCH4204235.1 GNAT family N-acetyltransferase [Bifidobacterium tibiigranuli]MCH4274568.1 GNAT family N-acetyltransferase [Bifidobacterium tibiigranuli]MCI1791387.1 GNAT family N-acetyltransferase [Bifidobacterium tibiigranuli]